MKELHTTQLSILKKLLFSPELRYTDLKPNPKMDNNQFGFHLDKMIEAGHIIKQETTYTLTAQGKEYANQMDTRSVKMMKQAKIGTFVAPIRERNGELEYLIYTRLKHPFYGCQGFMSGKVPFGSGITESAQRELKEETNLDGEPEIISIRHFLVFNKETNELVEDKLIFQCRVLEPMGKLQSNEEGEFEWVPASEIFTHIKKHFEDEASFKTQLEEYTNFNGTIPFHEIRHYTDRF